jgi:NAD(P)-dependent dehydrogenase (short-subunit alcohol dehydrogenase family)
MSGLKDLAGKVAVVTGGASGIGRGIASRMIAVGMRVVIADVESAALKETSEQLGVIGVQTDVRDPHALEELASRVLSLHGRIDVLCNNAGVGPLARLADMTHDDWRWMIEVNLWGVINGIQSFLPILRANPDGGHIVNTASIAGLTVGPGIGAYCVTKFGVVALTETLALELELAG